jgi:hypothetical protein
MHKGVQKDSCRIYFIIFGHFYQFLQILKVWTNLCYLKQLEKRLNSRHSIGPKTGSGLQPTGVGALSRGAGWRPGPAVFAACVRACTRAHGAGLPMARRRLASGEVHPESTSEALGWCRASRAGVARTRAAGRREESFGTAAFAGGEGAPVVVVECDEVL